MKIQTSYIRGGEKERYKKGNWISLRIGFSVLVFWVAVVFGPISAALAQEGKPTEDIRGKMSLEEIATDYQVPASFLIERLKLPANTSLQEPLKDLKDRHNFELETVRTLVQEYRVGKGATQGGAAMKSGGVTAGTEKTPPEHVQRATASKALILGLYGLFCLLMLLRPLPHGLSERVPSVQVLGRD